VKYGIALLTSDRGITPAHAAQIAEAAGFDSFAVPEHTHIPVRRQAPHPLTGDTSLPDDRYLRTLDPWVALATAAAVTSTIRLGTAVALPVQHDPIALAKTIASLDHLSGGRVTLGIGFGWNTDELAHHGVPADRRRTALREYLESMRALWSADEASYHGEFVSFGPSCAWPKPPQQSGVGLPVLVGAGGTERTFRWIARSADGWIATPQDTEIEQQVALLHRIWKDADRDGLPLVSALAGRPDLEQLARWAEAGVTEALFGLPDRSADDVAAYIAKLATRLGIPAAR
jgi:probable F420-dependent oxidoreductase